MDSHSYLPLHTLAVSYYQDVLKYFPQNSAELKKYVEKAERVALETRPTQITNWSGSIS